MGSSSNTFGTFLQTFDALEKQSAGARAGALSAASGLIDLVKEIAKAGNRLVLKDLVAGSQLSKEELLSLLVVGKSQGLIAIQDEQGEAIANLTGLGKLYAS